MLCKYCDNRQRTPSAVSDCIRWASKLAACRLSHRLTTRQLFTLWGNSCFLEKTEPLPCLFYGNRGAGPVRWFSSETIMCWFTVRGRAFHSHCFLLTGKWLSGLPKGGSVWEGRREGAWWVIWKVDVFKVLWLWMWGSWARSLLRTCESGLKL